MRAPCVLSAELGAGAEELSLALAAAMEAEASERGEAVVALSVHKVRMSTTSQQLILSLGGRSRCPTAPRCDSSRSCGPTRSYCP